MTDQLIICDPDFSELDGSGKPELHPARFPCACGLCQEAIAVKEPCVLIDREIVCAGCAGLYAPYRGEVARAGQSDCAGAPA